MEGDETGGQLRGRGREAGGREDAEAGREFDGAAEGGGDEAAEERVLGVLLVVGNGVRVEAETDGGGVEADAERFDEQQDP